MDPQDVGVEAGEEDGEMSVERWLSKLENGRQLAAQMQQLELGRKMKDEWKINEELKEGEEVWVMFPQVRKGKAPKLAFKMHGPYVLKEWTKGKKSAKLVHLEDPKDEIKAHVDRMFPKRKIPQQLLNSWKPLWKKTEMREESEEKKQNKEKDKVAAKGKQATIRTRQKQKQVGKKSNKEREEEYELEKIVEHVEYEDGDRDYRVRFAGFGPTEDIWIPEHELLETAAELVSEYQEKQQKEEKEKLKGGKKSANNA